MEQILKEEKTSFWVKAEQVDRRVIYLLIALALALPLLLGLRLPPARMAAAEAFYQTIDALPTDDGKLVLLSFDFGPGTSAENAPQAKVTVEHLMRKRIPFALVSLYTQAVPILRELPLIVAKDLAAENPGQKWEYGKDWINLGYKPQPSIFLQGFSGAKDLHAYLRADAEGTPLKDLPLFSTVHTIRDIKLIAEFTGLVGVFSSWIQYFQADGYTPKFLHGCTSITIPEAYLYYSSKQIQGFFEGIAGAAWYDKLLNKSFPNRKKEYGTEINSGLAFAQIAILVLIFLGNLGAYMVRREAARKSTPVTEAEA